MPFIRLVPVAALWAVPLAAQNPSHYTIQGPDVAVYNLAGVVQVEAGKGDDVAVDLTRGGTGAGQLRIAQGEVDGRATLRVIYPSDRIQYPKMEDGWTEIRVREDGTFDDHDHDGGREVRISSRGGGLEAWADMRVAVPAGRTIALYLAVGKLTVTNVDGRLRLRTGNAPVTVNGARGGLDLAVGSGEVQLSAIEGELNVATGSGAVNLTRAKGPTLAIETGSGDVAASVVEAQNLAVRTGSGTVTVELRGDLDRLAVNTGSGDIAITAPATLSARVNLETASGEISSDFPLAVTRSAPDHIRGTVGDGKATISVETGSGGVRLLRAR